MPEFNMTIDKNYAMKLLEKLFPKYHKIFYGLEKNLENTVKAMKWWYIQMPLVKTHPSDMNSKTASRYFVCSYHIHELIRILHFLDKFEEAEENYDIDDILKVHFINMDLEELLKSKPFL